MTSIRAIFTFFLLFVSSATMGFGQNGHRIVAQLALNHMTPASRVAIDEILQGESLLMAANWADYMRSSPEPFWTSRVSEPWHYVNTKPGESYDQSEKSSKGDLYEAIHRFLAVLKDSESSIEEQRDALRWIAHLIGDIHQPMHCGYKEDRGGNLVKVKWFGDETNLHTLWDTHLIESAQLSYSEFTAFIDTSDPSLIAEYQNSTVKDWLNESNVLRDDIYEIGDGNFSYDYKFANMPVVQKRLQQAGIRLAGVLNSIYNPASFEK
jgi:hypothetical protein